MFWGILDRENACKREPIMSTGVSLPNGTGQGFYHRVDIELGECHSGGEAHEECNVKSELIYAEQEIHNLLEIRGLPESEFWKVAEQEWEKCAKQFGDRVEGKKTQVLNVSNEIYQLVGFSSTFQGLLLTAASQGTWLSCDNKWWVLTLSLFASSVTAAGVWQKNSVIWDLQKTINSEDPTRKSYVRRLQRLKQEGPKKFDLHHITQQEERRPTAQSAHHLKKLGKQVGKKLCSYRPMIFFCLCTFGMLCAVAMNMILCKKPCHVTAT